MIPMLPLLPILPFVSALHTLTPVKLDAGARALVTGVKATLTSSTTPFLFSSPTPTLLDRSLATSFTLAARLPLPRLLLADFAAAQLPHLAAHAAAVQDAAARKKRGSPLDRLARGWAGWTHGAKTGAGAGWAKVAAGVGLGLARGVGMVASGWARGRGIAVPDRRKKRAAALAKAKMTTLKKGASAWF